MLGEPETHDLRAQFGAPWPGLGVPIDVDLQWRSPDGVLVNISLSHNAHWGIHDYRLIAWRIPSSATTASCSTRMASCRQAAAPQPQRCSIANSSRQCARTRAEVNVASVCGMRVLQAAWDTLG